VGLMNGERFIDETFLCFLAEFKEEIIFNEKYIKIASRLVDSDGLYLKTGDDHVYYLNVPLRHNEFIKRFCNTRIHEYVKFQTILSMITSKYPNVADDELVGYECSREVIEVFKKVDRAAIYPFTYWANKMLNFAIDYFYAEDEKFEAAIKSGKYASSEEAYFDVLFHGMQVLQA